MKPVIVLAFSNDRDDYLPMINRERKNVYKTLQDLDDKDFIQVHKEESTSITDIFELFNRYQDRVVIFHYGGHANGTHLQLETTAGDSQLADAGGLAQLMGQQKGLQLVFLNGCATKNQVELLLSAGVKAVIATSVPIDDKMAVEFSEQFYNTLANQASIQKAFVVARAFITTKYGQSKEINLYRDISWKGKETGEKKEVPWGLYINEKSPEVLEWKISVIKQDSAIIRIPSLISSSVPVNTKLIETLFKEVAKHSIEVGCLMEAYNKSKRMDIRMVRQAIIDSFPSPVGEQLRRLFASTAVDVERLRQLVATYKTTIELLCFTMLSQLWEAKYKNPDIVIADDYLVEFNSFFALGADNYQEFNYVKLIEAIAGIFKENNIKCFIEELGTIEKCVPDEKDEFYNAHLFMEEMKIEILEDRVKADEIESFCIQAEDHLGIILSRLAFFVKYKLTTIKRIEIIKRRHKEPKYSHSKVILDRVTAGMLDEVKIYDSFTDNNSVILMGNVDEVGEYLSLSPFVIDENALKGHQNSKIFFYTYQDISKGTYFYNYKFIDNEEEKLVISDKEYPLIREQFEELKKDVLIEPHGAGSR